MARMLCLVTGCAGFIGFHVTQYLLDRGERVIGIDDLNAYYDVALKQARLAQLQGRARFEFNQIDVADPTAMTGLAERHSDIDTIIHLAAQAGVRYSLTQPLAYVEANVKGQVVLLETARKLAKLKSLVYASSSSVYGANTKQPFSVEDRLDHPVSLYAATKRAGELVTESYCRLYGLPCTGLRFFTVYGRGAARTWPPSCSPTRSSPAADQGVQPRPMARDFTYVDDIVPAIVTAAETAPAAAGEHRLYNLGNNRPEALLDFIAVLEGRSARRPSKRCCRCSSATSRRPMPISDQRGAISASSRARRSRSACRALSRGTGNITASTRRTPRQDRDGGTGSGAAASRAGAGVLLRYPFHRVEQLLPHSGIGDLVIQADQLDTFRILRVVTGLVEKIGERRLQDCGDFPQPRGADPVGAALVFLHLLKGQAELSGGSS